MKKILDKAIKSNEYRDFHLRRKLTSSRLTTHDYFYIPNDTTPYFSSLTQKGGFHPSDYALSQSTNFNSVNKSWNSKFTTTDIWVRGLTDSKNPQFYDINGHIKAGNVVNYKSVTPMFDLDVTKLSQEEIKKLHISPIGIFELGEYPQTVATSDMQKILTSLLYSGKLKQTGKTYKAKSYMDNSGKNANYGEDEYEYNGEKYVYSMVNNPSAAIPNGKLPASVTMKNGNKMWFKVEPIKWQIVNWNELPANVNPNGSGSNPIMSCVSQDAIIGGVVFNENKKHENSNLWQNSFIRAYLNGYSIEEQLNKGNGDIKHATEKLYNFKGKGFIEELFGESINEAINQMTQEKQEEDMIVEQKQSANTYNLDYSNLTNDQMLAMYVEANTSVFLHGPSGVGKSGRVKQLDPTATRITLRPQMNPEEIDGTLNRETGEYIPPLWWTQLKAKCEQEPNRKHILFIDELTNVKPTVQSLVYSIVLDRAGKDGLWPLPENAVVVAAGNESQNNLAAYPLTNALFRRFSHIYYEVKMEDWFNWASGITEIPKLEHKPQETKNQERIHPLILTFVMSRKDVLNQELDEENPQIVTDPRKWEIASRVLYATKNPYSLKPAIGEELTEDFVNFTKNLQITVQDVISGNYNKQQLQRMDTSEKYVNTIGLKMVGEEHVGKIRQFIQENFGDEYLTMFDVSWIGNNQERAMIIAELIENSSINEDNFTL